MVLADLGRKITSALKSLSNATIINEEVNMNCETIQTTQQHMFGFALHFSYLFVLPQTRNLYNFVSGNAYVKN